MAGAAVQHVVAGVTWRHQDSCIPSVRKHNEVLLSNQQAVAVLTEIMNQNT